MIPGSPTQRQTKQTEFLKRCEDDPLFFSRNVLGSKLWSEQENIVRSVFDNKYTVVQSAYGMGKSKVAADIILSFLFTRIPSKVVTTSASWNQVEKILWSEIHVAHERSKVPLGGRLLTTELEIKDDWFAMGVSPLINVDSEAHRFEGFHSPNVLVVLDQAHGVRKELWDVAKALIASDNCRMLALGNPMSKQGAFHDACTNNELWHKIILPADQCPNVVEGREVIPGLVTREWIEDRKTDWGIDNPLYISKVLAQFPEEGENVILKLAWIDSAVNSQYPEEGAKGLGIDVARFGSSETVLIVKIGKKVVDIMAYQGRDTMKTVGNGIRLMRKWGVPAKAVCVDDTGIGGGVVDRLKEEGFAVQPINNGSAAEDKARFADLSSEMHWELRNDFEKEQIDIPDDEVLISQLSGRKYHATSKGQIKIEGKEDLKKRGRKSPDRSDALVLAHKAQKFFDPPKSPIGVTIIQ